MPDSFERHDKCQRPRISLQIKRCQPITPPIIRSKHREIPIFCPRSVCRGLRLQNTRKNARRHHPPHGAKQNKSAAKRPRTIFIQINHCPYDSAKVTQVRGQPTFPAHSAGRKNLRRTKCAAEVLSCPRTHRKGRLPSGRTYKTAYATVYTQLCLSSTAPDWIPVRVSRSFFITGPISVQPAGKVTVSSAP